MTKELVPPIVNQEERERFAPMFNIQWRNHGWCEKDEDGWIWVGSRLPDFCDIRSPYFGLACEELFAGGWQIRKNSCGYTWMRETIEIDNPGLGRCTMLALEKKRAMEEKK